ncbi:MAG: hypothetical protein ACK4WE_06620 [Burkholderiales bacterium]
MRMYEIASAEEQITLFKLITDKVWQSLADQKKQQDEQAAQQRRQAAMTGSGRAKRGSAKPKPMPSVPTAPPKPIASQPTAMRSTNTTPSTSSSASSPNVKTNVGLAQDDGLADERIAAFPQLSQQKAVLPIRLR